MNNSCKGNTIYQIFFIEYFSQQISDIEKNGHKFLEFITKINNNYFNYTICN